MIKELNIHGFKSIRQASIQLGKLNVFIGTNASGKSNIFEAFKFLQGIGYGFTIDEILNGKAKSASSIEWEGIRGGSENVLYRNKNKTESFNIDSLLQIKKQVFNYDVKVYPQKNEILKEELSINDSPVFVLNTESTNHINVINYFNKKPFDRNFPTSILESNLHAVAEFRAIVNEKDNQVKLLISFLSDQQRLDIIPSILRDYSRLTSATRIGEKGENFASVVKNILSDPKAGKEYLNWLRKLTPNEIEEIEIGKGAVNDLIFGIKENGKVTYAPSLSDGTLRFAAITAALFQPSPPKMLFLEEIENGIHPTRMRLLMELLMSRAEKGDTQIFITTHSPVLLDWIKEEYYNHVFFCARKEDGSTEVTPVSNIPDIQTTIKKYPLSELFTEGWLETTV